MSSFEIGESDITFFGIQSSQKYGGFAFFAISGEKIMEGMNQYA
jgi:hypothetical protein